MAWREFQMHIAGINGCTAAHCLVMSRVAMMLFFQPAMAAILGIFYICMFIPSAADPR